MKGVIWDDRKDIRVVLAMTTLIMINGPRGGIWWCEECNGGGFLDHPPKGQHRPRCSWAKEFP